MMTQQHAHQPHRLVAAVSYKLARCTLEVRQVIVVSGSSFVPLLNMLHRAAAATNSGLHEALMVWMAGPHDTDFQTPEPAAVVSTC